MGISIHYSGRIDDKQKLPQLIEDVQEIASVHGWKTTVYEKEFREITSTNLVQNQSEKRLKHDGKLYGIDFTPTGSEPVSIWFLCNRQMSSIMQLACWGNYENDSKDADCRNYTVETEEWDEHGKKTSISEVLTMDEAEYERMLYMCSTKTQFAGPDAHELIIGVLRYVSKTYLADFTITDEGQYWETGDKKILIETFKRYGFLIESFGSLLKNEQRLPDEDVESFIKRIASEMKRKKG